MHSNLTEREVVAWLAAAPWDVRGAIQLQLTRWFEEDASRAGWTSMERQGLAREAHPLYVMHPGQHVAATTAVPVDLTPLVEFITDYMQSDSTNRQEIIFKHFKPGSQVPSILQSFGSLRAAFRAVTVDREINDAERARFANHACPPENVSWDYISSGTAGLLGALFMMPHGVGE